MIESKDHSAVIRSHCNVWFKTLAHDQESENTSKSDGNITLRWCLGISRIVRPTNKTIGFIIGGGQSKESCTKSFWN